MSISQLSPQSNTPKKIFTAGIARSGGASVSPQSAMLARWCKPSNTSALAVRAYGHTVIGALGEALVQSWLTRGGYQVCRIEGADLRATDPASGLTLRVEVKTARRGLDGKWRARLIRDGHTDIRNSDHLIMLCVTPDGQTTPFSIPTERVSNRNYIVITSDPRTYAGRWAEYRAGWEIDPLCL